MVTAAPPSDPEVNATDKFPFPGVIPVIVDAEGTVLGVPLTEVEAVPAPILLTALIVIA